MGDDCLEGRDGGHTLKDRAHLIDARLKADGLYTMQHWDSAFTNPPLCITAEQLDEAFAIIDGALKVTDAAVA